MSDLMRNIFEKEWDLPSEAQGLRFIPELNIYGCDLYKNKEAADRKSSAWFYFQKAWKASRECQVIKLPERMEFASKGGDYFDGARNGFNQCLDACAISLKLSGIKVKP